MTGEEFTNWIAEMKSSGRASTDIECGRLIGKSADTVVRMKQKGASITVALACAAVINGLSLGGVTASEPFAPSA